MALRIRPFEHRDMDALEQITLAAFEPIFASFARLLGPRIYPVVFPDWRKLQTELIQKHSQSDKTSLAVAEWDGAVAGYVVYELHEESGEIQLMAVHPDYCNRGIGTALNRYAVQKLKEGGARIAVVATGLDESHAPARRSYEKAGFHAALPTVWLYQDLRDRDDPPVESS